MPENEAEKSAWEMSSTFYEAEFLKLLRNSDLIKLKVKFLTKAMD